MATVSYLCVLLLTCVCTQGYLTGDSCRDHRGLFARTWTQCSQCSPQRCRCVFAGGRLQADCERVVAPPLAIPHGCRIGEPIHLSTDVQCCPYVCEPTTLLEVCRSSFGTSFSEGDTWEECSGQCCTRECRCERQGGQLVNECVERCAGILLRPGCVLLDPFQNATHMDCCRSQCSPITDQTCTSSFNVEYREGENWEECVPGTGCCSQLCNCVRNGNQLESVCHKICPGIRLQPNCRIIEPFQNATFKDCCRTECSQVTGDGQYQSLV